MTRQLMQTISIVFHPLLLATYMFTVFYFFAPHLIGSISVDRIPTLILAVFLTTFLIPAFSIGVMKLTSKITSFEMTKREERFLPFLSIAMFYAATSYMFITQFRIAPSLAWVLIIVTTLIITLLLITIKFKISIHGAANWAAVGILAHFLLLEGKTMLIPLIVWTIAAGLVSTSRLSLGRHTNKEVWIGNIYGFLFAFLGLLAFKVPI